MLQIEKKFIAWINSHMVFISLIFTVLVAIWIRMAGRNYVGNDYHFSLYDIPGNCNSFLFRNFVAFLMAGWADHTIQIIKISAYIGDFGVALLVLLLLRRERKDLSRLQIFLAVSACLLSPVPLLYSVSGMKIDSVCTCLLLLGLLLCEKGWILLSVPVMMLAAFLYPAYWPIAIVLNIYMIIRQKKIDKLNLQTRISMGVSVCILALSVFVENLKTSDGCYWGKIFIVDPYSAAAYSNAGYWLLGMFRIYGYSLAMFSLLLSFRRKKLRIPALLMQLLVLMVVGWYQTSHFAV